MPARPVGLFLMTAYALRVRQHSENAAPQVERLVTGKPKVDTRALTKLAATVAGKAFREGVEFGSVYQERVFGRAAPSAVPLEGKAKRMVFEPFFAALKLAYGVYALKSEARLSQMRRDKADAQRDIIFGELVKAVRRAINRVSVDAAAQGLRAVRR